MVQLRRLQTIRTFFQFTTSYSRLFLHTLFLIIFRILQVNATMKFTAAILSIAAVVLAQPATASPTLSAALPATSAVNITTTVMQSNVPSTPMDFTSNSSDSITNSPVNITNSHGLTLKVEVTAPGPDGRSLDSTIIAYISYIDVLDISNSTHSEAVFKADIVDDHHNVLVTLKGDVTETNVSASAQEHS